MGGMMISPREASPGGWIQLLIVIAGMVLAAPSLATTIYGGNGFGGVVRYNFLTDQTETFNQVGFYGSGSIAFGPDGLLYGLNGFGGVNRYNFLTDRTETFNQVGFGSSGSIAFGPDGLLYGLNGFGGVNRYNELRIRVPRSRRTILG
jgi:hypothetical protein